MLKGNNVPRKNSLYKKKKRVLYTAEVEGKNKGIFREATT